MKNEITITKLSNDVYNIKAYKSGKLILDENDLNLVNEYIDLIAGNIDNYRVNNGELRVLFNNYSILKINNFNNIRRDKVFMPLCKELSKIIKKRKMKKNISKVSRKILVPAMFAVIVASKLNSTDDIVNYSDGYDTFGNVMENDNNITFTSIESDKFELNVDENSYNPINIDVIDNNSIDIFSDNELESYDNDAMLKVDKTDYLVSVLPYINDYISKFGSNMYDDRLELTKSDWKYTIEKYCNRYGVDTDLFIALVAQESGGISSNTPSRSGDIGLTQNHYESWVGKTLEVIEYDEYGNSNKSNLSISYSTLTNPDGNIQVGVAIFQYCIEKFDGNIYAALLSYNMGENTVRNILKEYANDVGKSYEEVKADNYDYGWFKYIDKYSMHGDENYLNNVLQFFNKDNFSYKCHGNDMNVSINRNRALINEDEQIKRATR